MLNEGWTGWERGRTRGGTGVGLAGRTGGSDWSIRGPAHLAPLLTLDASRPPAST